MPNREPDGASPQPASEEADAAPSSGRTIRLADLKNKTAGRVGTNATPAIKPVKVMLALPSRPAPEPTEASPSSRPSPISSAEPHAKRSPGPLSPSAASPAPAATPIPLGRTDSRSTTPSKKPAPISKHIDLKLVSRLEFGSGS